MTPYGLTDEQKACFLRGECTGPDRHKWVGPNFPTPEGNCPFCIDPEVLQAFQDVQVAMMQKEAAMPVRSRADILPVSPAELPAPIAAEILRQGSTRQQRIDRYRSLRTIHRKGG